MIEEHGINDTKFSHRQAKKTLDFLQKDPKSNFASVNVSNSGEILSLILAASHPRSWSNKWDVVILAWYSSDGSGMKVMRKFLNWVKCRPNISLITFHTETDLDERSYRIMSKRYNMVGNAIWKY